MNKRTLSVSLLCLFSLSSCGLFGAAPSTTPRRMSQDMALINPGTIVNVVSLVPMDTPNSAQSKIVNSAVFRVTEDVKGYPNTMTLIPQNALISGIYSNDGTTCHVSWQVIYADYSALEKNQGTMDIAPRVSNTSCDAKLGIRAGQLMNITFK
jgi:hypothetical protein